MYLEWVKTMSKKHDNLMDDIEVASRLAHVRQQLGHSVGQLAHGGDPTKLLTQVDKALTPVLGRIEKAVRKVRK